MSTIKSQQRLKLKVPRWSNVQRAAANDATALTEAFKKQKYRGMIIPRFGLEYLIAENKLDEAESSSRRKLTQPS